MEIIIKTEKDFCDCISCRIELLKEFSRQFKMNVTGGKFKVTDNENKVKWKIRGCEV